MLLKKGIPEGFDHPTALPNDEESRKWQELNQSWWENHPMRYDWKKRISYAEFTREFYYEMDRRFLEKVREYMPWKEIPFDPLIDFHSLREKKVLEIGIGNGMHAALLSQYSGSFTGIDITDYAVTSTSKRFQLFDLDGSILKMDAERLQFDSGTFDFVWSWGVIHHSSNTAQILKEIHRVLKPHGIAIIMVYNRSIWNYYLVPSICLGILKGYFFRGLSLNEIVQLHVDGAFARFYTPSEWRAMTCEMFNVQDIQVYGAKPEVLPIPGGRLKDVLLDAIPDSLSRFFTNRCKMGSFLVSKLEKR